MGDEEVDTACIDDPLDKFIAKDCVKERDFFIVVVIVLGFFFFFLLLNF